MDSAYAFGGDGLQASSNIKPDAIDLSSHLSQLARNRLASPLKKLYPYFGIPGELQLAGGLPSPAYFPFESISARVLATDSFATTSPPGAAKRESESSLGWLWNMFVSKVRTTEIEVKKYEDPLDVMAIQLSTALQYGQATGLLSLQHFIHAFTARVFQPGYANYETLLNAGSTDAWAKICTTLCESGDGILCEEFTYPSALAAAWPSGFHPVPCGMDGEGLTAIALEEVLANWDVAARGGMRRPTLLYTIAVCQNPTGATMSVERKRAIYAVCVKYDVIIVEDDPYYFLQAGEYRPAATRPAVSKIETDDEFLASLIPSFLKFDYQGRVVRIDTFSKTICPGSRLGWITTNPIFAERILRANESSTQAPCGFAQALITKLLVEEWGLTGYYRWLKGLKAQYRDRRDTLVDNLIAVSHAGLEAHQTSVGSFELRRSALSEKGDRSKPLLSFVAPQGGMFVWLRVHISQHRDYPAKSASSLIMALWTKLADNKVLLAPGTIFSGTTFGEPMDEFSGENLRIAQDGDGFFRLSFSSATEAEMKLASQILHKIVKEFFA